MAYDKFAFTRYMKCPYCQTGMVVVDNKVISCPICELKRQEKAEKLERGNHVSQVILI